MTMSMNQASAAMDRNRRIGIKYEEEMRRIPEGSRKWLSLQKKSCAAQLREHAAWNVFRDWRGLEAVPLDKHSIEHFRKVGVLQ